MSTRQEANTFIITREDRSFDPVTLVSKGLAIGRLPDCELNLNHPTVSPLHGGIRKVDDHFYIFHLSPSNSTTLNGKLVGEKAALAEGDVIQVGPFFLFISFEGDSLAVRVRYQTAVRVGDAERGMQYAPLPAQPDDSEIETVNALDVFWESRKREAGKMHRRSLLHPRTPSPILGKTQFNWTPTRDLIRPWPFSRFSLGIIVPLLTVFLSAYWFSGNNAPVSSYSGGLSWRGVSGILFVVIVSVWFALRDSRRTYRLLEEPPAEEKSEGKERLLLSQELLEKYDPNGPPYPHPVIITERCIGCHACVDACPHDVLAMVNGVATPIASNQCMDDTSCQVECPVHPKACIVVNTMRKIKVRKAPVRDASFMTNVPGCYIVGDVSHTPLIKNAINEGADAINHIAQELAYGSPSEPKAELDVAIVGIGPAGLSAAILAARHNLKYVGIEQDKVLSTVDAYPAGKYLFFKPETMESRGPIPVEGAGAQREQILETWHQAIRTNGVRINENESCKSVKKADDGDYFVIQTEKGRTKDKQTYRARRVIICVGNRGTPMKLRVQGEEMKVTRDGKEEDKVKYKLTDPEEYRRKKIIVVGAGNSAIESAVDLVARRDGTRITFRPDEEINEVTLVIRSDLKNDLKFRNKQQVYNCIDDGKIKVYFDTAIKEISDDEVVLMNARTQEVKATIKNDYIFAMLGGDGPTKFLESIGIKFI